MSHRGVRWVRLLLSGLLAVCSPSAAARAAKEPPETPPGYLLPEFGVSSTRTPGMPLDVAEFPGNVTIITADMIAKSHASSMPELLGQFEGVTGMDTNGFGLGADASVNLRGIVNSSRTGALVLLDGVRQNRPTGDEVHWQSIPLDQVERIEVIRGGAGLGYGEGALSGVINIVTRRGAQKLLETEETVELGSFGERLYAATARGPRSASRITPAPQSSTTSRSRI